MARPHFIFGGDTGVSSPEELKRLRAIAEALGGPYAPSNISEGLSAIGAALGGRIADGRANKMASAGEASRLAAMNPITGALYGGFPEAPKETVAQALSGDTPSAVPAGERASYIRDGMVKRGLPSHVADAFLMNFQDESGLDPGINEKAPLVPGSRGGFGLYQVTGPRRRAYEAFANKRGAPLDDVDAQLDFLMTELQGPESRAAKSILSAGNTGEAAAAIVNDFLRPAEQHRSSRERRYLRNTAAPSAVSAVNAMAQGQQMPQQVASLDPSARMGVTPPPAVPSQDAPQFNPTLMAQAPMAGTPMPLVGEQSPTGGPTPAAGGPQRAMAQPAPAMPQPPQARMEMSGQSDRPSQAHLIPQIMQAMQNPWLKDGDRAFLAAQLQKIQQENSPETLMARRKAEIELSNLEGGQWSKLDDGTLYNQRTGEIRRVGGGSSGAPTELGLNPQYGVDAQGNPVLIQLGKDGRGVQTQMPEGVSLSKEPIRLDAGTHFVLLDPITRQPIGQIEKDLAGAEEQKAKGKAEGEAQVAAPADMQSAQNALDLIASIRSDPNRQRGTGASANFNWIPGTAGYDFERKVEQAKSGAFMSAIQQLRGMGALSNAEGQTATAAVTRLNTAMTEEGFLEALADYEKIVQQGYARAANRLQGQSERPAPTAGATDYKSRYGLE